jgi:hypothetical protein
METATVPPPLERHALPEAKHSGLGIASFVLAIVFGLILFVLIGMAGYQQMKNPKGMDENSPMAMILGLLMIGSLLMNFVGAGLGLAGVLQKNRKKIFAILGLIFNGFAVLGTVALFLLGTLAS